MIQIDALTVAIERRTLLHAVSAELPPGVTCIIGPNGGGKTMLLRAVAGLLRPVGGRVLLDGEDIRRMDRRARARRIAYLPQVRPVPQIEAQLLVEHGRYPYNGFSNRMDEAGMAAVARAMAQTDTQHLAQKKLTELSGGERQRVYIAAALAQETDVLLLDEPTTYLDLKSQLEILRLIRALGQAGKTVVVVLHDIAQAFSFGDRLLLVDGGRFAAFGGAAELAGSAAVRKIFGCTIAADDDPDAVYRFRLAKGLGD